MKRTYLLLSVPTIALLAMTPAFAQNTITGISDIDDRITDIEDNVTEDFERSDDDARFGPAEFRPGFSGSVSLGYTAETGNTDSQEFNLAARLRFAEGDWVQTFGIAADFAEDGSIKTKEDVLAVYDANYYLNDRFYLFGLARVERDGLAETAGDVARDAFIGFGPGYRVINTPDMAWRLQAGLGLSYIRDGVGTSETEEGYLASSRFYYQFSESVFLTNDTDVLSSDTAFRANNDFGINFKLNDSLSTRVSYLTDYNDARAIETDNRLGVSLVVGF
jgi:putative salt-induced outer membrane protein